MRIDATVEENDVDTGWGSGRGLTITCSECGNSVDVLGIEEASEKAGCALLRETCPRGESNWYVVPGFDDASLLDRLNIP